MCLKREYAVVAVFGHQAELVDVINRASTHFHKFLLLRTPVLDVHMKYTPPHIAVALWEWVGINGCLVAGVPERTKCFRWNTLEEPAYLGTSSNVASMLVFDGQFETSCLGAARCFGNDCADLLAYGSRIREAPEGECAYKRSSKL